MRLAEFAPSSATGILMVAIVVVIVAVPGLLAVWMFNGLVHRRSRTAEAWLIRALRTLQDNDVALVRTNHATAAIAALERMAQGLSV